MNHNIDDLTQEERDWLDRTITNSIVEIHRQRAFNELKKEIKASQCAHLEGKYWIGFFEKKYYDQFCDHPLLKTANIEVQLLGKFVDL